MGSHVFRDASPEVRELMLQFWNLRAHFDQVTVMDLDFDNVMAAMQRIREQRDAIKKRAANSHDR